jgi:hypothetical protein
MTETAQVTQLPAVQTRKPSEIRVVSDPIAVLDTGRFEHMQRIANVMAHSNLVPDSLCMVKGSDDGKTLVALPFETVVANCFLVVNQAVRWNMDPFAVAQCVSVVHGKLCYEGKLIAAVLEAKLGIRLKYKWDNKTGDSSGIEVSGTFPDGSTESITGTVGDWKTTGTGSPWGQSKNYKRMLAYRGAREWCRLFAPGLMLGVLSDDEIEVLADDRRATDHPTEGRAERAGDDRGGEGEGRTEAGNQGRGQARGNQSGGGQADPRAFARRGRRRAQAGAAEGRSQGRRQGRSEG